jgi:hypothetical protein
MTLRGTYGGIFAEDFLSVPRSLETRTNRGFPHFHSDYGAGTRFNRKADPAKIAGPVRFLNRTGNPTAASVVATPDHALLESGEYCLRKPAAGNLHGGVCEGGGDLGGPWWT